MVRVVTPGTLTDTELLSDKTESMLLAVHQAPRNTLRPGLAQRDAGRAAPGRMRRATNWATGSPASRPASCCSAPTSRRPSRQRLRGLQASVARGLTLCQRPEWQFDSALGQRKLLEQLQAATLSAWNAEDLPHAHAAAAALLGYAEHTQGRALTHVQQLQVQRGDALIDLPLTTRRNLELAQTLRGEDRPTLFSLLDTCMTGMGSRTLKRWLLEPQRDRAHRQRPGSKPSTACAATVAPARGTRCAASSRAAATWSASPRASRCARCARANWWRCA